MVSLTSRSAMTTSACRSQRSALIVNSSGSPGPAPAMITFLPPCPKGSLATWRSFAFANIALANTFLIHCIIQAALPPPFRGVGGRIVTLHCHMARFVDQDPPRRSPAIPHRNRRGGEQPSGWSLLRYRSIPPVGGYNLFRGIHVQPGIRYP